ncbi:acyltransferase family protein [Clostridium puniceum]|uniref:Acyltransferase family protein n=1 Tax=Clostridium puniceum TaxID=29367 RepID=A0A1S8TDX6_9CLOT|nr:acyltransferase [Clostridium puniceum]OOM75832.1 acyltransferase family protein [Clostridium puniceum]
MNDDFTIKNTNYCKGIAIILMIIHHLFWNVPGYGVTIGHIALSQRIAVIGKVCVSIFLFLSGFGLYKSIKTEFSIKKFYCEKLYKLYINYIFIVITSIIISIVFFKEKYMNLIGKGFKEIILIILNLTGFQYLIGYPGLNGAWWFVSVILVLYILFPFLKTLVEKYKIKFVIIFFLISCFDIIQLENIKILTIISWGFPFILGVYTAFSNIFIKINQYINKDKKYVKKSILLILLIFSLIIKQILDSQSFIGIKFDYYLSFVIILSVYIFFENILISKKTISFLGKKSSDIYYIHMFISTYYLANSIYNINNVFFMIVSVIILSLLWSFSLDTIRKIIGWNNLIYRGSNRLLSYFCGDKI